MTNAPDPQSELRLLRERVAQLEAQLGIPSGFDNLQNILESLPVFTCVLTLDGVYESANGASLRPRPIATERFLGKEIGSSYPWAHSPELVSQVRKAVADAGRGEVVRFEASVRNSRNQSVDIDVSFGPMRGAKGEVVRVVASAMDVTERRRIHEALRRAQKFEGLEVLAGGIAHDFNNLLATVLNYSILARTRLGKADRSTTSQETRDALESARNDIAGIESAANRMAKLAKQMLIYSGRSKLELQPLDLSALIDDMRGLLESEAKDRGADLEWGLTRELPKITADPAQLQQIAVNLVRNAAEATRETNGKVTVRTGAVYPDEGMLADCDHAEELTGRACVYLEVVDLGEGMDPETRSRVFDPFFSTQTESRGLGLAVVQGIVRAHRGAVCIDTQQNVGTIIRVLLPASEPG